MTVRAEINDNNRIEIFSEFRDKSYCKEIPGARWGKESRTWSVPLSWASCKVLRSQFGARLEIGDELFKWATAELETRIQPSLELRQALDTPDDDMPQAFQGLYPFQRAGAAWLLAAKQGILADMVGAGKTIQVIAAAKHENLLPALVVCPNSCKMNWKRELEKWMPGVPVYVVDGTAAKRAKIFAAAAETPGVVIVNWESVRLHSRLAPYGSIALSESEKTPKELNQIPWKLVVADEAHRMKDPKSKQTRAIWSCGHAPSVEYRWALTGTPLTAAPDTLWPILHFLSKEEWAGKSAFIDRWCMFSFNPWGGLEVAGIRPEMETEFFAIFDPRMRRMPKEVVLPNLPPIIREQRYLDMAPKQAKAYTQMVEHMCSQADNGEIVLATNPISQLTRLVQFSSAFATVGPEGNTLLTDPSNKLDALMTDLPDWLDAGEPVVVFAVSRQLIDMAADRLAKKKIPFSIIEGGQTADQRQKQIDMYMTERTTQVCLVVIAAGSEGINLNRGRIAVFLQRPWSNVQNIQAEGRCHRIGSEHHENVLYVDYISNHTVEMHILEVLAEKSDQLESIVRDRAAIRRMLEGK